MLFKLIFMLLYYFFINLNKEKVIIKESNIKEKNIINIAKPQLLENDKSNEILFTLTIKDINIYNKPIYNINSSENSINKNITILKESDENTIFLAAHSGIGSIAYFKYLYRLKENDEILINYKDISYTYIVTSILETDKTGSITIPKNNNKQLVLTTCGQKDNKQLVVIAKIK